MKMIVLSSVKTHVIGLAMPLLEMERATAMTMAEERLMEIVVMKDLFGAPLQMVASELALPQKEQFAHLMMTVLVSVLTIGHRLLTVDVLPIPLRAMTVRHAMKMVMAFVTALLTQYYVLLDSGLH